MFQPSQPPVPAWHAALAAGDVVSFRFPRTEPGAAPPKARPCLVLATEDGPRGRQALIAYGTGRFSRANQGLEIRLLTCADRIAAGVHRPTRFVAARRVWAPLEGGAFVCGPADRDTPILGRLDGRLRPQMATILAQLPRRAGRITAFNQPHDWRKTCPNRFTPTNPFRRSSATRSPSRSSRCSPGAS